MSLNTKQDTDNRILPVFMPNLYLIITQPTEQTTGNPKKWMMIVKKE